MLNGRISSRSSHLAVWFHAALISQFLILSNSSPRLSSSCSGLGSKYLKRPGFIRNNRATNGDNGAGFRCCCSVSLSQPAVPDSSSSSVRVYRVHGGSLISIGAGDRRANIDPPSESQNQQSIFSSSSTLSSMGGKRIKDASFSTLPSLTFC
ncbi:hypothetical protein V6N11_057641 [Hibiscus sabdariffa]|uniref:Uncharacterized protein n=2 Tax=Hibiscus sabdariffa TaxID=183260 RepID=A0ABR2NI48_9ROSI